MVFVQVFLTIHSFPNPQQQQKKIQFKCKMFGGSSVPNLPQFVRNMPNMSLGSAGVKNLKWILKHLFTFLSLIL